METRDERVRIQSSDTPPGSDNEQRHAPYGSVLIRVAEKIKEEPFLFVIAVTVLLIGLTVSAAKLGSPDLRFIVVVVAGLALIVILGYYIREVIKTKAESEGNINPSNIPIKREVSVPLAGFIFDDRIDVVSQKLNRLHEQAAASGQAPSLRSLLSVLRDLFKRNTFDEPFPLCRDESWHERFSAGIQTEHVLRIYWDYVQQAASLGDEELISSYESVQSEVSSLCIAMTGLFKPPPSIGNARREFLMGGADTLREDLEGKRITPMSSIPEEVLDRCEAHRSKIHQEVQRWPLR